jgi:hypothetical protein
VDVQHEGRGSALMEQGLCKDGLWLCHSRVGAVMLQAAGSPPDGEGRTVCTAAAPPPTRLE